jgi:hypothetical protein
MFAHAIGEIRVATMCNQQVSDGLIFYLNHTCVPQPVMTNVYGWQTRSSPCVDGLRSFSLQSRFNIEAAQVLPFKIV